MSRSKVTFKINWDTECDGEYSNPESLGLPTEISFETSLSVETLQCIVDTMDTDEVIDQLSDDYGYCIEGFFAEVTALGNDEQN